MKASEIGLCVISNPDHPHYGRTGRLTGEVIKLITGTVMAKFAFESSEGIGGEDACFVSKGDLQQVSKGKANQ